MRKKAKAVAQYRCNKCGAILTRNYDGKLWTRSLCVNTGGMARLCRISMPPAKP